MILKKPILISDFQDKFYVTNVVKKNTVKENQFIQGQNFNQKDLEPVFEIYKLNADGLENPTKVICPKCHSYVTTRVTRGFGTGTLVALSAHQANQARSRGKERERGGKKNKHGPWLASSEADFSASRFFDYLAISLTLIILHEQARCCAAFASSEFCHASCARTGLKTMSINARSATWFWEEKNFYLASDFAASQSFLYLSIKPSLCTFLSIHPSIYISCSVSVFYYTRLHAIKWATLHQFSGSASSDDQCKV